MQKKSCLKAVKFGWSATKTI